MCLNTCKNCEKKYSRSEVIRTSGDVWWTAIYCSPQCYTIKTAKGEADVDEDRKSEEFAVSMRIIQWCNDELKASKDGKEKTKENN